MLGANMLKLKPCIEVNNADGSMNVGKKYRGSLDKALEQYVHDLSLIHILRRELRRGGQVYYLHNRVETIERCAAGIQMRLPEARVGFAHGKMSEDQLSDIWRQLLEHEIDILVCTTIIETGVDVPNANTLSLIHI